jgi:hypothetical protein
MSERRRRTDTYPDARPAAAGPATTNTINSRRSNTPIRIIQDGIAHVGQEVIPVRCIIP